MEIERKFLLRSLPDNLESYPCLHIEQAYLCVSPIVRVRRENDHYYLTYKGSGMMAREEYNMDLTKEAYEHLLEKADGQVISKKRYLVPLKNPGFKDGYPKPPADYTLTVEIDVFEGFFNSLIIAEVEFGSKDAAEAFVPPDWFWEDVTYCEEYHNSYMAMMPKE